MKKVIQLREISKLESKFSYPSWRYYNQEALKSLSWAPDSKSIAMGGDLGGTCVFDTKGERLWQSSQYWNRQIKDPEEGGLMMAQIEDKDWVVDADWSRDEKYLATIHYYQQKINIWETATWALVTTKETPVALNGQIGFFPDSRFLASAEGDYRDGRLWVLI